ncbi:hypothetical protein VM98_36655, partial [Streptomyces rubellomurinus subsp. indigoferus]
MLPPASAEQADRLARAKAPSTANHPTRRFSLRSAGGLGAALALGAAGSLASWRSAEAADNGFGLTIVDRNESDPRMWYYRFQ